MAERKEISFPDSINSFAQNIKQQAQAIDNKINNDIAAGNLNFQDAMARRQRERQLLIDNAINARRGQWAGARIEIKDQLVVTQTDNGNPFTTGESKAETTLHAESGWMVDTHSCSTNGTHYHQEWNRVNVSGENIPVSLTFGVRATEVASSIGGLKESKSFQSCSVLFKLTPAGLDQKLAIDEGILRREIGY
ncbi:hypothetical protein ACF3DV_04910 [Chlorogloeopsis fritschii PCC 9212]|uniref:Uncharacterized protein n=1 Tax=Chlorogloeopsis fritschii PCC 6912 TaxID=211165 RepID=A0A433MX87_CHLFR|nr:hypothetical protein [Chlorogloeopsis fritschii]RUR72734.1 hypothetical protein PCC6912_61090 [Chlorogloeopsis fritschii PCC 6912]